jgi:hypothetical protein
MLDVLLHSRLSNGFLAQDGNSRMLAPILGHGSRIHAALHRNGNVLNKWCSQRRLGRVAERHFNLQSESKRSKRLNVKRLEIEVKAKQPKANKNNERIETEMQQELYENIQERRP